MTNLFLWIPIKSLFKGHQKNLDESETISTIIDFPKYSEPNYPHKLKGFYSKTDCNMFQ